MQRYLNIFMNVMIILLVIISVYFSIDKFVLSKSQVREKYNYEDDVKNFNGSYVKEYYDVNLAHNIVEKYIIALKDKDINIINSYLIEDIKIDEEKLNSINNIESYVNIEEVRENGNKTEILITYSTKENRDDRNTMLCKLDREKQTFLICYDSLLNNI